MARSIAELGSPTFNEAGATFARHNVSVPAKQSAPRVRWAEPQVIDRVTFPIRAFTLFHIDGFGLTCLATERFDYVARDIGGFVPDIACGYDSTFVANYPGSQHHRWRSARRPHRRPLDATGCPGPKAQHQWADTGGN